MVIDKKPLSTRQKITLNEALMAFIPITECPFFDNAAAQRPNNTLVRQFPEAFDENSDDTDWQNVVTATVPSLIVAGLISTCYVCYRFVICEFSASLRKKPRKPVKNPVKNLGLQKYIQTKAVCDRARSKCVSSNEHAARQSTTTARARNAF